MVPEPCDDRLNPQHNTLLAIPHPGCAIARQQCSRYHPGFSNRNGGFSVCNACNTDGLHVLELHGPPNELNRRRLRTVGPPRIQPFTIPPNWQTPLEFASGHVTPTDPPSYRHNQFLTRMCRKCARIEQTLAQARYEAWVQAPGCDLSYLPGTNEMIEKSQWYSYPWSSCTCYSKLNLARPARLPDRTGPTGQDGLPIPQDGHRSWDVRRLRLCHAHREAKWKELEGARNQNDIWLQNIHLVTPDGTALRQATAAEMQDRVIGAGSWRACRVSTVYKITLGVVHDTNTWSNSAERKSTTMAPLVSKGIPPRSISVWLAKAPSTLWTRTTLQVICMRLLPGFGATDPQLSSWADSETSIGRK